jgi:DNA gyrase subunit B
MDGYLYIAQSPLYKITQGKDIKYLYSDEEKRAILGDSEPDTEEEFDENGDEIEAEVEVKKGPKMRVQRYKGLGEMNADELKETTMDKTNRILKRVTIDDAEEADKVFDMLMGTDVPARKSFITSNAKLADIDL